MNCWSFITFRLIYSFQFGDLDPGNRYTIQLNATSLGDDETASVRSYTFVEVTNPVEPTIVTEIYVTEHTLGFGYTNPLYFQVRVRVVLSSHKSLMFLFSRQVKFVKLNKFWIYSVSPPPPPPPQCFL